MTGAGGFDRSFVPVELFIDVFLPPVCLNALMKISLGIHKSDTDQRDAKIAGLLAVVAGEDSKAAGVNRQGSVETKLGREVSHRLFGQIRKLAWKPFVGPARGAVQAFHRD